jgi:hypothetical protein
MLFILFVALRILPVVSLSLVPPVLFLSVPPVVLPGLSGLPKELGQPKAISLLHFFLEEVDEFFFGVEEEEISSGIFVDGDQFGQFETLDDLLGVFVVAAHHLDDLGVVYCLRDVALEQLIFFLPDVPPFSGLLSSLRLAPTFRLALRFMDCLLLGGLLRLFSLGGRWVLGGC